MACVDDQEPTFKHHCRVCKKGFMCGRALGGHMRAHGIGDENAPYLDDEDDDLNIWDDKQLDRPTNRRMYQLRTNPNRLKSCKNCEHCGKEFSSWKSFLEHGKCTSDDVFESPISSHESEEEDYNVKRNAGWFKRKRSFRGKVSSNNLTAEKEDLLLASCLIQLANTIVDIPPVVELEESCASASREEERRSPTFIGTSSRSTFARPNVLLPNPTSKGMFECKACKKVFTSHQALGGHRASHKKVKGCYAAKLDQQDDDHSFGLDDEVVTPEEFYPSKPAPSFQYVHGTSLAGASKKKTKVHECSICHRVFSSGQALGGHKRCHWIVTNPPEPAPIARFQFLGNIDKPIHRQNVVKPKTDKSEVPLDLNVPAWAHISGVKRDPHNPLSFDVSTDPHLDPWTCGEPETINNLPIPNSNN